MSDYDSFAGLVPLAIIIIRALDRSTFSFTALVPVGSTVASILIPMSKFDARSYPHPCVGSRIFKRYVNIEDAVYEESIKYLNSTNFNLPFSVRMPYMFHRTQTKCFETLIQHYWFTEIQPLGNDVDENELKPVPMLIKIAFSWIVGYDQTFLTDKEFITFVRRTMLKRIGTWFHSCLTGPFPGCPDSKLSKYSCKVSHGADTKSMSRGRSDCSSSAVKR